MASKTKPPVCPGGQSPGEGGIRTHGTLSGTHALQACQISHSCTSPGSIFVVNIAKERSKSNELFAFTGSFRILDNSEAAKQMNELILVAEDQPHIRALIEFKLKNNGYRVVAVEDGEAALQKSKELIPDMILLDVMMPLMTGFEVLAALKGIPDTKGIPVLLVTAQSSESEVLKGLEMGAEDYITKPFSPNELAARIKSVLMRYKKK